MSIIQIHPFPENGLHLAQRLTEIPKARREKHVEICVFDSKMVRGLKEMVEKMICYRGQDRMKIQEVVDTLHTIDRGRTLNS